MPLDLDEIPDFFLVNDKITSDTAKVIVLGTPDDPNYQREQTYSPSYTTTYANYSNNVTGNFNTYAFSGTYYLSGSYIPISG